MTTSSRSLHRSVWRIVSALIAVVSIVVGVGAAGAGVISSAETPAEINEAVETVLARPEYTGEGQSLVSRVLLENPVSRWIRDMWSRFIDWLTGLGGDDDTSLPTTEVDPARSAGGLLIVVLLLGLVGLVVYRLGSTRGRVRGTGQKGEGRDGSHRISAGGDG